LNIGPLMGLYFGTALAHDSAAGMFDVNESRMALANGVTGSENSAQLAAIHNMDKALALRGQMDAIHFKAAQLMADSAREQLKKNEEQRRRLMADGATFV
jgi:hypothetical protein